MKNTKSQLNVHHSHKERNAVTMEEEMTLDQETEDPVTALDQGMIGLETVLEAEMTDHVSQEEDLDSGMTSHANSDNEKGLALVTTGHEIEIVMINLETVLET